MRLLRHSLVLTILILFTLLGSAFFTYQTFEQFHKQQQIRPGIHASTYLKELSILIDTIDNEALESASYLIRRTSTSMQMMLAAREKTDRTLLSLYRSIEGAKHLQTQAAQLQKSVSKLHRSRRAVVALPDSVIPTMFEHYYIAIDMPLVQHLDTMLFTSAFDKEAAEIRLYQKILTLRINTDFETLIGYTALAYNMPLSTKEVEILKEIQNKETPPHFKNYIDETSAIILSSILEESDFKDLTRTDRAALIEGASSGTYGLNVVTWLEKNKKKQEALAKVEKQLYEMMKEKEKERTYNIYVPMALYALLSITLLYTAFRLLLLRAKQIKNKKLYDDTRRDIELVFTPEEQKKLHRLIESGNVDMIYKFLIQAIKDANHTKDLFLANMSHEIRTPLNGIVGFTQLLKETRPTEDQKEFIAVIEKSSTHLLKIVNDILDLAKIKAQKIELESIPFDPLDQFENAVETYAGKALKENIDLNVFIDPHLPTPLLGDPTKISQVLVNLISNAIKFTPKNGEVSVTVERRSESDHEVEIYFAVSDTGIGISKEQRQKIFQAFSQADVSTSRKYGGTGLGLSISGKLIELMGGKLGIRSIVHEGSTFYFTLKLSKTAETKPRECERFDGVRIGILDPHMNHTYLPNDNLAKYLGYTGAQVVHYTDNTLMRDREEDHLPPILFIDHKFRQRGGELEKLLTLDSRIILLTTSDQKRNLQRYRSEISKILYKPVTFHKTMRALSQKEDTVEKQQEVTFSDLHILVAEDNSINQQLIARVLNNIGVDVTIANNGEEALELRKKGEFDMIFMDIEMPVMGGMEATAKILGYEREGQNKHIPIIALTANALSGDRAKYLGVGMDGYLAKPIDLSALRELLLSYFPDKEQGVQL